VRETFDCVFSFANFFPECAGKIMRRILRKIASGDEDTLGDVSTLADPGVVAQIISSRPVLSHYH
jgi:hypothetical protein